MASTVADARTVWEVCEGFDPDYAYAKNTPPILHHVNSLGPQVNTFSFGIPPPSALEICNPIYKKKFAEAIETLKSIGGVEVPLDWSPFEKAGQLLYNGTFVSERLASLPDGWLETNRDHLHPVILEIFENVTKRNSTAVEAYRDLQAKAVYVLSVGFLYLY
jgi:Asp-tRNA(Asn)/Glu-tRNA(Gln) amidotransferase A subunit family amidase